MEERETLLTVAEAADYLGVTYRAVLNWIGDGSLSCYRIGDGRSIRIGMTHIQKYLQAHEVTGETINEYEAAEAGS